MSSLLRLQAKHRTPSQHKNSAKKLSHIVDRLSMINQVALLSSFNPGGLIPDLLRCDSFKPSSLGRTKEEDTRQGARSQMRFSHLIPSQITW